MRYRCAAFYLIGFFLFLSNSAAMTPPDGTDSPTHSNCPGLLGRAKQVEDLIHQMQIFFATKNSTVDDRGTLFGPYKVVQSIADGVIISMRSGLHLVSQAGMGSGSFKMLTLAGTEIIQFEKKGEYFIVITQDEFAKPESKITLHLIHQTLEAVEFKKSYRQPEDLTTFELPYDRGVIFQFSNKIIILQTKFDEKAKTLKHSRLGSFDIRGEIKKVEVTPLPDLDAPLMAVSYEGGFAPTLTRTDTFDKSRIAYLDWTLKTDNGENTQDHLVFPQSAVIDMGQAVTARWVPTEQGFNEYVLLTNVQKKHPTEIYSLRYSAESGFKIKFDGPVGPYVANLESLVKEQKTLAYTSFNINMHPLNDKDGSFEPHLLIVPDDPTDLFQIKRPSIVYKSKNGDQMYQADERASSAKLFSDQLAWRYVYIPEFGFSESFSFESSLPLKGISTEFPVTAIKSDGTSANRLSHPFLFARVEGADNEGVLVINTQTADILWVAGLNKIRFSTVNRNRRVEFWGQQTKNGKLIPLLSIYDFSDKSFSLVTDLKFERSRQRSLASYAGDFQISDGELQSKLKYLEEPDNVLIAIRTTIRSHVEQARFFKAKSFGTWSHPDQIHIQDKPEFDIMMIDIAARRQNHLLYVLNTNNLLTMMFGNKIEITPEIDPSVKEDQFFVIASDNFQDAINPEDIDDGIPGIPWFYRDFVAGGRPNKKVEKTFIQVYRRTKTGAVETSRTEVRGQLFKIRFVRDGTKVYAIGQTRFPGLTRDLESEFRWDLKDKSVKNVMFNKVEEPMYSDDELDIYVSQRSSEGEPRVIIYEKGQVIGQEISLAYNFKEEVKKTPIDEYFDFIYGRKSGGPQANQQNIDSVRKDGELLFITTEHSVDKASLTFIYNLEKRELMSVVPNYKEYIDMGKHRFYIGETDQFYPTIVAVFNNTNHRFIRFFDLGRLKLKTGTKDYVSVDGDYIRFLTTNGSVRVFDTKDNYFLGTIPRDIEEIIGPAVKGLGVVLNREIFQSPLNGFHEREAFMSDFQQAFPLAPGKFGGRHVLLIAENGAGRTDALKSYVYRYITGALQPRPKFKAVFLKLNPSLLAANTMFRGTKAAKYTNLAEAARALGSFGYRMVVVIDDVTKFLPKGELVHADAEGDFFQSMSDIMESGELDVIATTSPGGAELLQRREGGFYNLFKRTLRMDPMTRQQAAATIQAYVREEFNQDGVLSNQQIHSIIDRVAKLNTQRVLPGSAHDIIKQVISEMSSKNDEASKPRRRRLSKPSPIVITDEMIDAAIAQKTGVPRVFLDKENLAANADKMKSYLKSLVKGIDDIIDQMVNDLFAFALEANRADWPVLRALAMGPTGTGKTELIKAVTNFLFNSQAPRLKISGEDWKTPDGDRLKDLIVRHTKQFPYNIIHYDEFDKMHPENQETVLSLGDGEIVGSEGEKVSTSLSIIYGASNLGVAAVRAAVAASRMKVGAQSYNSPSSLGNEFNDIFLTAMRNELKPEVVNRFDRYYVYPFMKDDIALAITEDYLNGIEGSGIESIRARYAKKGISLEFDKSVIRYIADNFIDLELGGRRLTINIENAVVKEFLVPTELYGGLKANGTKYVVTYNGRAFEIFQIDKNLISTSTGITNPTAH